MAKALDDKDQQLQNTQPQILKLESLRGQDEDAYKELQDSYDTLEAELEVHGTKCRELEAIALQRELNHSQKQKTLKDQLTALRQDKEERVSKSRFAQLEKSYLQKSECLKDIQEKLHHTDKEYQDVLRQAK
ncbi:MAG: hypothetical protein NXY57DRAFT_1045157, partial [Lentinula lateritia]